MVLSNRLELNRLSKMCTVSIIKAMMVALMMDAVRTSDTSVYFYETTRRHIPEGCLPSSHTPPPETEISNNAARIICR
jgi:hypothetical protein